MASSSPSEFLTFYRRLSTHPSIRQSFCSRTSISSRPAFNARSFALSSRVAAKSYPEDLSTDDSVKTDKYPDNRELAPNRDGQDVQSAAAKGGRTDKESGTGGHATEQRDLTGSKQKAKEEHPEAPDVAIGMQDERGGKGV